MPTRAKKFETKDVECNETNSFMPSEFFRLSFMNFEIGN
jgi:hypothetical protein